MGNGGGGGGGSGLPPIEVVTEEVMPETTLSFSDTGGGMYTSSTDFVAEDGANYVVTWDGTDYPCSPLVAGGMFALGNLGLMGGEDTGEPFLVTNAMGVDVWVTLSTAATHTIKVGGAIQSPADGTALVVVGGEWSVQDGYGYTKDIPDLGPVVTKINSKYIPSPASEHVATSTVTTNIGANSFQAITFDSILPSVNTVGYALELAIHNSSAQLLVVSGGTSANGDGMVWVYNPSSTAYSISAGDTIHLVIIS